jgi:hypothetical protein
MAAVRRLDALQLDRRYQESSERDEPARPAALWKRLSTPCGLTAAAVRLDSDLGSCIPIPQKRTRPEGERRHLLSRELSIEEQQVL